MVHAKWSENITYEKQLSEGHEKSEVKAQWKSVW